MKNLTALLSALLISCGVSASEEITTNMEEQGSSVKNQKECPLLINKYREFANNPKVKKIDRYSCMEKLRKFGIDFPTPDATEIYAWIAGNRNLEISQRFIAIDRLRELGLPSLNLTKKVYKDAMYHSKSFNQTMMFIDQYRQFSEEFNITETEIDVTYAYWCLEMKTEFNIARKFKAIDKLYELAQQYNSQGIYAKIAISYDSIARNSKNDIDGRFKAIDRFIKVFSEPEKSSEIESFEYKVARSLFSIAQSAKQEERNDILDELYKLAQEFYNQTLKKFCLDNVRKSMNNTTFRVRIINLLEPFMQELKIQDTDHLNKIKSIHEDYLRLEML